MTVKYKVKSEDGYAKVYHSERGLICAGVLLPSGEVYDIAFLDPSHLKTNKIRQPAMRALARFSERIKERKQRRADLDRRPRERIARCKTPEERELWLDIWRPNQEETQ